MDALIVELPDKRGELARLADAIAQQGINITGCCGATAGAAGAIVLMTDNDARARGVLDEAGYRVRKVELVSIWVSDRPGGLAEAARRLDDAGVNIEALIPTRTLGGNVEVAFATDNPGRARSALGDGVLAAPRG
ncbi:MAG: hypothetical protein QOH08_1696 [Chloroflexota bacterium]|nr:hypothetical protein [Chloroflexota bacterium]